MILLDRNFTGLEREHRWRESAAGGRNGALAGQTAPILPAGNAANAAVVAEKAAGEALKKWKKMFRKAHVTSNTLNLVGEACITLLQPLQLEDFGFILIDSGICIARIGTMYSKTAGKNGKYAAITDSSSISAITSLGVQIYENHTVNYFNATPRVILSNYYFQLIPSIRFIMAIPSSVVTLQSNIGLVINKEYMEIFQDLKSQTTHLIAAIKAFNSTKGGGNDDPEDEV
ncbi:hypothetical protein BDQ17DRAFT_1434815 [Cyathus striatus]|nr:hypothetical protein BDQ17DRAFT_1434815 [Cyathus striatus]